MNLFHVLVEQIMIPFLKFSYSVIPNYGVAILMLTLLVKLLFIPLTQKQFKAMLVNQKIQPLIKDIQEKYKGQPEKLQKEMMRVWKENNANPFGGCLPALIQLPVFFAIFYTIKSPLFQALIAQPGVNPGLFPVGTIPFFPQFAWIPSLGIPDHTFILPVLIAASTYWSQKLFITDPKQAALFIFMPVVMFFVSIKMPAGVLLYWAASQLLSTAHQLWVMKTNTES
ncbi:MAG: YidC/Oxa1 family membrane protein insertase [Candidatus Margulisiibacteriota bacterium]